MLPHQTSRPIPIVFLMDLNSYLEPFDSLASVHPWVLRLPVHRAVLVQMQNNTLICDSQGFAARMLRTSDLCSPEAKSGNISTVSDWIFPLQLMQSSLSPTGMPMDPQPREPIQLTMYTSYQIYTCIRINYHIYAYIHMKNLVFLILSVRSFWFLMCW